MLHRFIRIGRFTLIAILGIAISIWLLWQIDLSKGEPAWGLTFSDTYAEELGLNPREVYTAILDELQPARLRLVAYWNRIEPSAGTRVFADLDRQMYEAKERNIPTTLAIGYRTPRWPECHIPSWAGDLSGKDFEQALSNYLEATVLRYRENPALAVWQVENEPFLGVFGRCPAPDPALLRREIALVRSLDPSRPILVTDSGELGYWPRGSGLSDVFGTTLYRYIWNGHFGSFQHVFPPAWYGFRGFLNKFTGTPKTIVAELQTEPWGIGGKPLVAIDFDLQVRDFGPDEFRAITTFAKKTGLSEAYLWGAEWWYWRKTKGDARFWDIGKELFARNR